MFGEIVEFLRGRAQPDIAVNTDPNTQEAEAEDHCEFKVSLVYLVRIRTARTT